MKCVATPAHSNEVCCDGGTLLTILYGTVILFFGLLKACEDTMDQQYASLGVVIVVVVIVVVEVVVVVVVVCLFANYMRRDAPITSHTIHAGDNSNTREHGLRAPKLDVARQDMPAPDWRSILLL